MRKHGLIAVFLGALALFSWETNPASGLPGPPAPPGPPPTAPRPYVPPRPYAPPPMAPRLTPVARGPVYGPVRVPAGLPGAGGVGGSGIGTAAGSLPGAARGAADLHSLGALGSLARTGGAEGVSPTFEVNREALAYQAGWVRNYYNYYNHSRGDWWRRPGAWKAERWARAAEAADAYSAPTWGVAYGYCGYGYTEPTYYDYGSNVVSEGDSVYVNGDSAGTQEQYAQQATSIADAGRQAREGGGTGDEWLPLGVFAIVYGEQKNSNDNFQLAVNKAGVIRGNYYNVLADTTLPVYGSVDPKSQRAAWTVGESKDRVFEAGFGNLTKSETTMLVHFGKDRTEQWTLVRIEAASGPR